MKVLLYTERPVRSLILKHTSNIDQYFQTQYEQQVKGHCRKYASPVYINVLRDANNVKNVLIMTVANRFKNLHPFSSFLCICDF